MMQKSRIPSHIPKQGTASRLPTVKRQASPPDQATAHHHVGIAPPLKRTRIAQDSGAPAKVLASITNHNVLGKTRATAKPEAAKTQAASRSVIASSSALKKPVAKKAQAIVHPQDRHNSSVAESKQAEKKEKRAAWDLKGRLFDMEKEMSSFKKQLEQEKTDRKQEVKEFQSTESDLADKLQKSELEMRQLRSLQVEGEDQLLKSKTENIELRAKVSSLGVSNQTLDEELQSSKRQVNQLNQDIEKSRQINIEQQKDIDGFINKTSNLKQQLEDLDFEKQRLLRQKSSLESELSSSNVEISGLKSSIAALTSSQQTVQAELSCVKTRFETCTRESADKDVTIAEHLKVIEQLKADLEHMRMKEIEFESQRRKLHNTIQELKGNIRVFCRVRPLIDEETLGNNGVINHMAFPDQQNKRIIELEKYPEPSANESNVSNSSAKHCNNALHKFSFNFDRVFSPESSQSDVFDEISQLVQSALDGYNVCIFAYGQTGSGKTYTMEGSSDSLGMIPRAVNLVFSSTEKLKVNGWQYNFEVSVVEIYNETIRDLLGDFSQAHNVKHEIKKASANSNDVVVSNLKTVKVTESSQINELLKLATKNRAVAATKCNQHSSRSHSIFRLKITGDNSSTGENCNGLLNLVDLAGSERLKESESQGARLTETQNINKSLANLGNVIMALSNKDSHVPYRNSKLTHLLMNSLGGNSKTLMFVNLNPREDFFQESLNSLRFATKVNNCNIGTAQKS